MGRRKMTLGGLFDLVELQCNEEELEDYFSNSSIIIEELKFAITGMRK